MRNKNEIRSDIRALKKEYFAANALSKFGFNRSNSDERIWNNVKNLAEFQNAKNLLLYYSLNDEVDTHKVITSLAQYKNIFLPAIKEDDSIVIRKYTSPTNLSTGNFGILEPENPEEFSIKEIDCAIIPAMGISSKGQRIGRGKGYYDRLLADSSIPLIGIIYDFQLCEPFESAPHDIPMNYIVTESQIINV